MDQLFVVNSGSNFQFLLLACSWKVLIEFYYTVKTSNLEFEF